MIRCMRRTNIYLEDRQCNSLDRLAEQEGVSRAEVVRRLLDQALHGSERAAEADRHALDASFGVLADIEDVMRRPDERAKHLDAVRGRTVS